MNSAVKKTPNAITGWKLVSVVFLLFEACVVPHELTNSKPARGIHSAPRSDALPVFLAEGSADVCILGSAFMTGHNTACASSPNSTSCSIVDAVPQNWKIRRSHSKGPPNNCSLVGDASCFYHDQMQADCCRGHSDVNRNYGLEGGQLVVYIGHGEPWLLRSTSSPTVPLQLFSVGDKARYLWLFACRLMAHGKRINYDYPAPESFLSESACLTPAAYPGGQCHASIFHRWGGYYSGISPLNQKLRLVCGFSNRPKKSSDLFSQIWRFLPSETTPSRSLSVADAFLTGVFEGMHKAKPVCATRGGLDWRRTPLTDKTFSPDENSILEAARSFVYIEYVRANEAVNRIITSPLAEPLSNSAQIELTGAFSGLPSHLFHYSIQPLQAPRRLKPLLSGQYFQGSLRNAFVQPSELLSNLEALEVDLDESSIEIIPETGATNFRIRFEAFDEIDPDAVVDLLSSNLYFDQENSKDDSLQYISDSRLDFIVDRMSQVEIDEQVKNNDIALQNSDDAPGAESPYPFIKCRQRRSTLAVALPGQENMSIVKAIRIAGPGGFSMSHFCPQNAASASDQSGLSGPELAVSFGGRRFRKNAASFTVRNLTEARAFATNFLSQMHLAKYALSDEVTIYYRLASTNCSQDQLGPYYEFVANADNSPFEGPGLQLSILVQATMANPPVISCVQGTPST